MSDVARFNPVGAAEIQLPCADLGPSLVFFQERLGFRIETIYPADDPTIACLSGHGLHLRLAPGPGDPGLIRLPCLTLPPQGERLLTAPNGTRVELVPVDPLLDEGPFEAAFSISRQGPGSEAAPGRAGMLYRDLIPGRLGGRYIASHITIPHGGPVPDWVHFHKIRFQIIYCRAGWARLVYEDQGEPFTFAAGDCVLQPPLIRHRVLEASEGFEVVEISSPALHETVADHDMTLPNGRLDRARDFGGQLFHHHLAAPAPWIAWGQGGVEIRDTGLEEASGGRVGARVMRSQGGRLVPSLPGGELTLGFILAGSATLDHAGRHALAAGDAFVIPPGDSWSLDAADKIEVLVITTPLADEIGKGQQA